MTEDTVQKIFLQTENGGFIEVNMTLPMEMLFDDIINFISKTDFEN